MAKETPKPLLQLVIANIPLLFTSCSFVALFVLLILTHGTPHSYIITFVPRPLILVVNSSSSTTVSLSVNHLDGTTEQAIAPEGGIKEAGLGGDRRSCDIFDGRWVVDEESSLNYRPESCPFIDDAFNCAKNGRKDTNYTKLRWQPNGCNLPRLDGKRMLEMLKGKRLSFVGDSLNRNMWESLVCILRNSLQNKCNVFEVSGRQNFKSEVNSAFKFTDYNCTIEFFRSPFLVQEWETMGSDKKPRSTLRLDQIDNISAGYRDADVLIFNTAHWWTHGKTSQGKDYYQEGDHVYSHLSQSEAYRKALTTWARWVDANIDPTRTSVFFRGYSASHFNGGNWNGGGMCDGETEPITDEKYMAKYPKLMRILEAVMVGMQTPVGYLNVTRMTEYRKDGHPSVFREAAAKKNPGFWAQDCSHWCLPGVPDVWNQLLYVMLLRDLGETDYYRASSSMR